MAAPADEPIGNAAAGAGLACSGGGTAEEPAELALEEGSEGLALAFAMVGLASDIAALLVLAADACGSERVSRVEQQEPTENTDALKRFSTIGKAYCASRFENLPRIKQTTQPEEDFDQRVHSRVIRAVCHQLQPRAVATAALHRIVYEPSSQLNHEYGIVYSFMKTMGQRNLAAAVAWNWNAGPKKSSVLS